MNYLEEVQAQFESKNKAGEEVNILAYHPGQEYPIIGESFSDDAWVEVSFTEEGCFYSESSDASDLIKKRPVLPKDILCEVWNDSNRKHKRLTAGDGKFYNAGASSATNEDDLITWDNYRVIENPPQPWFGGEECPIPEGCEYQIRSEGRWRTGNNDRLSHRWSEENFITAYQILGEKESK